MLVFTLHSSSTVVKVGVVGVNVPMLDNTRHATPNRELCS